MRELFDPKKKGKSSAKKKKIEKGAEKAANKYTHMLLLLSSLKLKRMYLVSKLSKCTFKRVKVNVRLGSKHSNE